MERAAITELLQEVRTDRAFHEGKVKELSILDAYLTAKLATSSATPVPNAATKDGFASLTQLEAARTILSKQGSPMNTNAIVDEMVQRGFEIRSDRKTLVNSVFSVMRRNPKIFKKVGRGMWGLV